MTVEQLKIMLDGKSDAAVIYVTIIAPNGELTHYPIRAELENDYPNGRIFLAIEPKTFFP